MDEQELSDTQRKANEMQTFKAQNDYYKEIHGIVANGKQSEVELFAQEVDKKRLRHFIIVPYI